MLILHFGICPLMCLYHSIIFPLPSLVTGQYEELKRTKDYLEEEIYRLKAYKKECSHLKAEYKSHQTQGE